jgi:hypothetical protein
MTPQSTATVPPDVLNVLNVLNVLKPTPAELMEDTGTGLDYGTRPDRMPGFLTPADRFFVRSHSPTPHLDTATWTLRGCGPPTTGETPSRPPHRGTSWATSTIRCSLTPFTSNPHGHDDREA